MGFADLAVQSGGNLVSVNKLFACDEKTRFGGR
jgi:hypothetical protein